MKALQEVDVHVDGDGAETVVMVHGWPDTYRLWDATVDALKARFRCVRFTLPGFDRDQPRRARNLDELCAFMKLVIEQHVPDRKAILLLHDWGCIFGYQFYLRHPEMVSRIVGVDIGDLSSLPRMLTAREKLFVVTYQWWLALAWKIGGKLGDWMTRSKARRARYPADPSYISSCMNYPYYVTWFGGSDSYRHHSRRFQPDCPMLFVFGRKKPVRFHSQAWTDQLLKREGNQVVEFDAGHWVMLNQQERFNQVVGDWLSR